MKVSPKTAFLSALGVVALIPVAVVPFMSGYGTIFGQVLGFGAWAAVAEATSDVYVESHMAAVWATAFVLNVLCFLVLGGVIWAALRKRWPSICSVSLGAVCVLQLLMLFVLFPATIGP
jgi:glucan phosphoethanolaminetransferase (alkaline phosphatase superfamily)